MRRSPARALLLWAIALYRRWLSPHKGFSCAYRCHTGRASCSTLGLRAVRRHGAIGGLRLIRRRTRLCGLVHRRQAALRALPLGAQRGACDIGCDLPGDLSCDLGGHRLGGGSVLECCDCCSCDWPSRRGTRNREKYVDIPPARSRRPRRSGSSGRSGVPEPAPRRPER